MVLGRFAADASEPDVRDLTLARARSFQDSCAGLSPGSVRGFVRALRTFSSWLAYEGYIDADPLVRLRIPRADRRVVAVPTDVQLVAVMRASAPPLRTVLALIAGTGLRVSDVAGLELADMRDGELVVGTTKSRAGRLVPLDPVLASILRLYVATARPVGVGPLVVARGGGSLTADAVRHALADAVRRSDCGIRVTPHVLRHWHARDLAANGIGERTLAARMGWADGALAARYAPVAHAELVRDVARYSPLVRLRDEGLLDGLFPAPVLRGDQRSKNEGGRGAAKTEPWRTSVRAS
jgi:site-specific recombinase XerD